MKSSVNKKKKKKKKKKNPGKRINTLVFFFSFYITKIYLSDMNIDSPVNFLLHNLKIVTLGRVAAKKNRYPHYHN